MDAHTIPATSGIYRIVNTINGLFYLGSAVDLRRRWRLHYNELQRNDHHNSKLQRAWNKYGPDAFTFEVLEFVLSPFLLAREQYWLDKLKPGGKKGYNINLIANSRLGGKASPETLERLRIGQNGKHGKGISRIERDGYSASPETREKMKNSHLGKTQSEEARLKTIEAIKNRPPASAETRQRMSIARLGHPQSAEAAAINKASKIGQMKTLIVTSPDGVEQTIHGVKSFCREHNLDCSNLMRVAQGIYTNHKGWKARYPETDAS